jgi:hypothetical protein
MTIHRNYRFLIRILLSQRRKGAKFGNVGRSTTKPMNDTKVKKIHGIQFRVCRAFRG